ncbi:hypothetical protein [Nocardioides mangrovi]|uniref:Cellulose synthase n=1 Tax=Nocardioides mangrovi TaxID=2874580 RepID=A0ABS7UJA8_9ACTN|nr:hypothetical protein [Nocardioides mangrovi]MBZ5741123.1 hypothetical protein [Nocardioides mangrovi]
MDDASWAALALSLTVAGGIWTWFSFRRRGIASGLRALAFTLLPVAAYLTRTLRLLADISHAVSVWASNFVWRPTVWLGLMVLGVSVLLFGVSARLRRREKPAAEKVEGAEPRRLGRAAAAPAAPAVDPEMAEIEALLRKRGIS